MIVKNQKIQVYLKIPIIAIFVNIYNLKTDTLGFLLQLAYGTHRSQRGALRVIGQGLPLDLEKKAAKIASSLNLMDVFADVRVGDQFDLRVVESNAGQGNGRGDIGILGVLRRRNPGRAFEMDGRGALETVQVEFQFRR